MQDIKKFTVKRTVLKSQSQKCSISELSSPHIPAKPSNKIPRQEVIMSADSEKVNFNNGMSEMDTDKTENNVIPTQSKVENIGLQQVIEPLLKELRLLRESVGRKYTSLETAIEKQKAKVSDELSKIEKSLATHRSEITADLDEKVTFTHSKMNRILDENKKLHTENSKLLECRQRIELQQLNNNVIILGIAKAPWKKYEFTKQRVHDTVAASMGDPGDVACQERVKKVEIMCCSRVGRYRPNHNHQISITF